MMAVMCAWCGKHPVAFDTGNGNLECEPCAKRDGLVHRGELKAALDALELAVAHARTRGATDGEILQVVGRAPDYVETFGGEVIEVDGARFGEPGEWQRGYVAVAGGDA
jgi:hypothetical protein